MQARDLRGGIDARGYALIHRDLQVGDQIVFGAWIGSDYADYKGNLTGKVTRVFKYAIQVNGLPVKQLDVSSVTLLNEGVTKKLWFQGVTLVEYGQEVR